MTSEERLRAAIRSRTSRVEAAPDALDKIQETLMRQRHPNRTRILAVIGTAAAVVAAVVIGLTLADDDGDRVDTADSPTTSVEQTTTTTEATIPVDPATTVFPDPATSRRFDDPRALVTAFATDFLDFREPIVGELVLGDSRSGEVEVRAFAEGSPTTVLVRLLEDDTWFVLGAVTKSIQLDTPAPRSIITSPQALEGAAYAFEGTVTVLLHVDGVVEPVAQTIVTGRGDGVLGDFSGELTFAVPESARYGVLVLFEASAEDGSTVAAHVIRVHF